MEILKSLNYSDLVSQKYIPDLNPILNPNLYIFNGSNLYIKYMIYKMLSKSSINTKHIEDIYSQKNYSHEFKTYFQHWLSLYKNPIIKWNDIAHPTYYVISSLCCDKYNDEFNMTLPLLNSIDSILSKNYTDIRFDFNDIDIKADNIIFNIILSNNIEYDLLFLLYCFIKIKPLYNKIDSIGLILPLSSQILVFNISDWNTRIFFPINKSKDNIIKCWYSYR